MKLRTLGRIIKWFEEYQPNLTDKEGTELYEKLIDEEQEETRKALREKELLEFLDGVGDTLWVYIGHLYFGNGDILELDIDFTPIYQQINFNGEDFIDDLLNEIADSNFSKSYELQGEGEKIGKVIKGPNFKKPDIQKIIDKYKIEWK